MAQFIGAPGAISQPGVEALAKRLEYRLVIVSFNWETGALEMSMDVTLPSHTKVVRRLRFSGQTAHFIMAPVAITQPGQSPPKAVASSVLIIQAAES